jgi:HPt (histidine-containing phosphotransfer) domain-containing protein
VNLQNHIRADEVIITPAMLEQIGTEAIDLSGLTSLSDLRSIGEPDLVIELIDLYLKEGPERIRLIKASAAGADEKGLKQAAHTLRGSSASLGFHQISGICERLEHLDWCDSHDRLDDLTELLQHKFSKLREALLDLRQLRLG